MGCGSGRFAYVGCWGEVGRVLGECQIYLPICKGGIDTVGVFIACVAAGL